MYRGLIILAAISFSLASASRTVSEQKTCEYNFCIGEDSDSPVFVRITSNEQLSAEIEVSSVSSLQANRRSTKHFTVNDIGSEIKLSANSLKIFISKYDSAISIIAPNKKLRIFMLDGASNREEKDIGLVIEKSSGEKFLIGGAQSNEAGILRSSFSLFFPLNLDIFDSIPRPFLLSISGWGMRILGREPVELKCDTAIEITAAESVKIKFFFDKNNSILGLLRERAKSEPKSESAPKYSQSWFKPWISFDSAIPPSIVEENISKLKLFGLNSGILYMGDWSTPPLLQFRMEEGGDCMKRRLQYVGSPQIEFEALRETLRSLLSAAATGVPIFGHDIGSFLGRHSSSQYRISSEAFIRWIQFAAFSPVMQLHLRQSAHEIWNIGDPLTVSQFRDYSWIHSSLAPYLFEAASKAREEGIGIIRPLFFADEKDSSLFKIDDEYMLGDDVIVAPILERGLSSRKVILPGGVWYDFWSGRKIFEANEANEVVVAAPLEIIPVFIKEGIFFPMLLDAKAIPGLSILNDSYLTLRFFPNSKGHAELIMRSGKNTAKISGQLKEKSIIIKSFRFNKPIQIWIDTLREMNFANVYLNGKKIKQFGANEEIIGAEGWKYEENRGRILIRIPKIREANIETDISFPQL